MNHPDEQVLLPCVREEFHVPLPAMPADHHETRQLLQVALAVNRVYKAPVHLEAIPGPQLVASSAVALFHLVSTYRVGTKVLVFCNVYLDCGQASTVTGLPRLRKNNIAVADPFGQKLINQFLEALQL
ncbi:hypothetical protein SDC9_171262 [bioreactor metagenome]|uniref:Uncharacterized protein n=1 Tax=bioreactor metagenome TaxID=1076179 RepID=A0A645GDM3_9ZZZZ